MVNGQVQVKLESLSPPDHGVLALDWPTRSMQNWVTLQVQMRLLDSEGEDGVSMSIKTVADAGHLLGLLGPAVSQNGSAGYQRKGWLSLETRDSSWHTLGLKCMSF